MNDIIIYKIPNVPYANLKLQYNLRDHESVFGSIERLSVMPAPPEQTTTFGFLKFKNTLIPEAVEYLKRIKIPNTLIRFEINSKQDPTQAHHPLNEVPVSISMDRQLTELEKNEPELGHQHTLAREKLEWSNAIKRLSDRDRANEDLINKLRIQNDNLRDENFALRLQNQELEKVHANGQTLRKNTQMSRWEPLHRQQPSFPPSTPGRSSVNTLKITPSDSSTHLGEGTCAICIGKLAEAGTLASVKCGYVFCELCLYNYIEYLKRNKTNGDLVSNPTAFKCPNCRTPLGSNSYTRLKF